MNDAWLLLYYLGHARTHYPGLFAQWEANADWQAFVRLAWARGHFWTTASQAYPGLDIHDAAIGSRINDPNNLVELTAPLWPRHLQCMLAFVRIRCSTCVHGPPERPIRKRG